MAIFLCNMFIQHYITVNFSANFFHISNISAEFCKGIDSLFCICCLVNFQHKAQLVSAYKHCNLAMPALRVCVCFMSIPPVFLYYESVIGMLSWSVVCAYSVLKA